MIEKLITIREHLVKAKELLAELIEDGAAPVEPIPPVTPVTPPPPAQPDNKFPFDLLPALGQVGPGTFVNVAPLLRLYEVRLIGVGTPVTWSKDMPAGTDFTLLLPPSKCTVGKMPHASMFQNGQFWVPHGGDLCAFTAYRFEGAWYLTFSEGNHPGNIQFGTPGWRGDGYLTPAMAYEWGAAIGQPKPLRRAERFPARDKNGPVPWVTFAASHRLGRTCSWGLAGLGEGLL